MYSQDFPFVFTKTVIIIYEKVSPLSSFSDNVVVVVVRPLIIDRGNTNLFYCRCTVVVIRSRVPETHWFLSFKVSDVADSAVN